MGAPAGPTANVRTRVARRGDARAIAELYQAASNGFADLVWSRHVSGDTGTLDVGEQVFARSDGRLTCDHSIVVEDGDAVVGMMVAFPSGADGGSRGIDQLDRLPIAFQEWPVERSLHIAAMILRPAYRGQGLGAKLLGLAETEAVTTGLGATTMIVPERNAGACRFLLERGYMEFDRQDLPAHPQVQPSGMAILFAKYVG